MVLYYRSKKKFIKSFKGIFGRSALEEEATQEDFEGIPVVRMVAYACPLNKKTHPGIYEAYKIRLRVKLFRGIFTLQ